MDVGNFISDLLAQHGEVSVPGLGYFAHTRVNGHYNEHEGVFYPPSYSVQFEPQIVEDQTLAQFIADRKNISLASSKYFTEKYISNIKLQAQSADVPFGDMGVFYTEGTQLYFKPNTISGTDPDFFGFEPIKLTKLGSAPVTEKKPQYIAQPAEEYVAAPVTVEQEEVAPQGYRYETDEEHEAYLAALARKRRVRSTIIFVVLALILTAAVIYLVNRYNPSVFNLEAVSPKTHPADTVANAKVEQIEDTTAKQAPVKPLPADTTTVKENTPAKDTLSKVNDTATSGIYYPHWEAMGGSFKDDKEANQAIANYKKLNIDAHIVTDAPGKRAKVSLGTFKTRAETVKAINDLLQTKKVNKDIYPLEIKPKL